MSMCNPCLRTCVTYVAGLYNLSSFLRYSGFNPAALTMRP
jgi:hypothetical protein